MVTHLGRETFFFPGCLGQPCPSDTCDVMYPAATLATPCVAMPGGTCRLLQVPIGI